MADKYLYEYWDAACRRVGYPFDHEPLWTTLDGVSTEHVHYEHFERKTPELWNTSDSTPPIQSLGAYAFDARLLSIAGMSRGKAFAKLS